MPVKLTLKGKYQTDLGTFDFDVNVEGEKAVELWDLIFKQTTTDKGVLDITDSSVSVKKEEAPPEAGQKVDELLSLAKELTGASESEE